MKAWRKLLPLQCSLFIGVVDFREDLPAPIPLPNIPLPIRDHCRACGAVGRGMFGRGIGSGFQSAFSRMLLRPAVFCAFCRGQKSCRECPTRCHSHRALTVTGLHSFGSRLANFFCGFNARIFLRVSQEISLGKMFSGFRLNTAFFSPVAGCR
jgi:hypothetical protein